MEKKLSKNWAQLMPLHNTFILIPMLDRINGWQVSDFDSDSIQEMQYLQCA